MLVKVELPENCDTETAFRIAKNQIKAKSICNIDTIVGQLSYNGITVRLYRDSTLVNFKILLKEN